MKRSLNEMSGSASATWKKPKFLTKAEREELALQHHRQEVEEQTHRSDGDARNSKRRYRGRRERDRSRERSRQETLAEREREKELEAMKEQYLGWKKREKRVIKPSDRFRFSFDWENTEDTSRDMNSLYQNPHEARLLFGRGFRAGMDRREQKKLAVTSYDTFDMKVDRHWSDKKLEEMTERDWRIFREDFNISYKGSKIPKPMRNWVESNMSAELLEAVRRAGYEKPSAIQMAAIPLGLRRRDVIGIAETGSGKTAAFVLPMLAYISRLPPMTEENETEGPYALVMAPTRELALQIADETLKFAQHLRGGYRVVAVVGGQSIEEQGFRLRQGCEIIIATPGRLTDCIERRLCVLNQCNYVVLDEADRMIDMGFEPQVVRVLDAIPCSNMKPANLELEEKRIYRTTYMFSATMLPAVERLARKYLRNPVVVHTGTAGKATGLVTQHVIMVREPEKIFRLQRLLDDELGDKKTAIVFVNAKKTADMICNALDRAGYRATTLHSGMSQEERQTSLDGFKNNKKRRYSVLVATDLAGRGIDIPDVAHVINLDMPKNIETYSHRIGRTGRAGKSGVATTFLTLSDSEVFYDLKHMLIQSNSLVPPELARHEASKFKPGSIPGRPPRRNGTVFAHSRIL